MTQIELIAGEKQKGETKRAIQACNDWLRLGAGRSFPGLARKYAKLRQNAPFEPPTTSVDTLKRWSIRHGWAGRADLYDAQIEEAKNQRAKEIMESGLALIHERVQKLKTLVDDIEAQIFHTDEDGHRPLLWLEDRKMIGSGEDAEVIDLIRYNKALVEQYRGALDDLAKETGGRKQTHLHGGDPDSPPIGILSLDHFLMLEDQADQSLAQWQKEREKPEHGDTGSNTTPDPERPDSAPDSTDSAPTE